MLYVRMFQDMRDLRTTYTYSCTVVNRSVHACQHIQSMQAAVSASETRVLHGSLPHLCAVPCRTWPAAVRWFRQHLGPTFSWWMGSCEVRPLLPVSTAMGHVHSDSRFCSRHVTHAQTRPALPQHPPACLWLVQSWFMPAQLGWGRSGHGPGLSAITMSASDHQRHPLPSQQVYTDTRAHLSLPPLDRTCHGLNEIPNNILQLVQ